MHNQPSYCEFTCATDLIKRE